MNKTELQRYTDTLQATLIAAGIEPEPRDAIAAFHKFWSPRVRHHRHGEYWRARLRFGAAVARDNQPERV